MPTYQIQAPDGNTYRIDGPPGATDDQVRAEVLKQHPTAGTAKAPAAKAAAPEGALARVGGEAVGALEGAANVGSSVAGSLGGGLTYLATLGATGGDTAAAKAVQQDTQQALTYQPRSKYGQANVKAVGNIMEAAVEKPTEYAGDLARRGVQAVGASPEVSGLVGSAVKTGLQAVPMALGLRSGAAAARGVEAEAQAAEAAAKNTAREYVARNTSVDWDGLPAHLQNTLSAMARRGEDLRSLDPKAVERVARAQSHDVPVPLTRAQATRSTADFTREEAVQRSDAGTPLRERQAQQDTALHQNLARVREDVAPGSKVKTSADVGPAVQSAARRKLQTLKAQSTRLYEEARQAGEMQAPVKWQPIEEWLKDPANKANAGWIEGRLKAYAEKDGSISINNLERVRQEVNAKVSEGGTAGHYAAQAKNVIDQILDNSGSEKYRAARSSWREWNQEFKQQKAVRDLTGEKTNMSDRRIALEGTTDYILKSDRESLQSIKDTLTKGGTERTRARGEKAWKDLQAGVIQKLREEAAGKRGIRNEADQEQFNSSFLDRFNELDRSGKLEVLFGPEAAGKLRKIAETVHDVRTKPAARVSGSDTVPRLISMLEVLAHKVPGVGPLAVKGVKKVGESVRAEAAAKRAATDPLEEAAAAQAKKKQGPPTLREHYKRAAAGSASQDRASQ